MISNFFFFDVDLEGRWQEKKKKDREQKKSHFFITTEQ